MLGAACWNFSKNSFRAFFTLILGWLHFWVLSQFCRLCRDVLTWTNFPAELTGPVVTVMLGVSAITAATASVWFWWFGGSEKLGAWVRQENERICPRTD